MKLILKKEQKITDMKTIFTIILTFVSFTLSGNINYIQFEKIPDYEKHIDRYNYIKDNEAFYNHWQPEWTYDISKKSLVRGLKECYKVFSGLDDSSPEVNLLLGDISHYLYNHRKTNISKQPQVIIIRQST